MMERGLEESRKIAGIGQTVARRHALLADAGNRAAPDNGHEAAPSGSGDGSDDGSNETLLHMLDEGSLDDFNLYFRAISTVTASKCFLCSMTIFSLPHRPLPR